MVQTFVKGYISSWEDVAF